MRQIGLRMNIDIHRAEGAWRDTGGGILMDWGTFRTELTDVHMYIPLFHIKPVFHKEHMGI